MKTADPRITGPTTVATESSKFNKLHLGAKTTAIDRRYMLK